MCTTATGWSDFTMRENALPDIALTGLSDWQQAQTLMVNNYRTQFPALHNIPFKGLVYPAELVTKTAQLERDVVRQQQALLERDLRIKALEEQNARAMAAGGTNSLLDPLAEARAELAEQIARGLQKELAEKQARSRKARFPQDPLCRAPTPVTAGLSNWTVAKEPRATRRSGKASTPTSSTPSTMVPLKKRSGAGSRRTCDSWRRSRPLPIGSNWRMRRQPNGQGRD